MPAPTPQLVMTRLNANEAREALFASDLQPSDAPTAPTQCAMRSAHWRRRRPIYRPARSESP